jgi:site-specific DNA-methyltransferase (adenine-specific)
MKPITENTLFYGDNLKILREYIPDESVDLIYLDPPFNSNRNYNVLFSDEKGGESKAQIKAFDDTWQWHQATDAYAELIADAPSQVSRMISAMKDFIGTNQMMAYLVMMTIRLLELHRVLKQTGSLYLHCDPTASHYLKIVLDTIFGNENFRNEVTWCYRKWNIRQAQYPSNHDILLFYSKSEKNIFNTLFLPKSPKSSGKGKKIQSVIGEDGKRKSVYLDVDSEGTPVPDWWEIPIINPMARERLGYPTQKPLALLERIIAASSNEGDLILDPFAGCGTTIAAAEKLNRRWIGVDITYLAVALLRYRLNDMKQSVDTVRGDTYQVIGLPESVDDASYLKDNKDGRYQFQWWALSLIKAKPVGGSSDGKKGKKGADAGIDGEINFIDNDEGKAKRLLVQVKSGKVGPKDIRDLSGTVGNNHAVMGVFITLEPPTDAMKTEAANAGYYVSEGWNQNYPKIQILTIEELLNGAKVNMPPMNITFKKARIEKKNGFEQNGLPS